jgi:hypothetical protein
MKRITNWTLALLALVGFQSSFTQAQQALPQHGNELSPNDMQFDGVLTPASDGRLSP